VNPLLPYSNSRIAPIRATWRQLLPLVPVLALYFDAHRQELEDVALSLKCSGLT
jgi:hypothetical protein